MAPKTIKAYSYFDQNTNPAERGEISEFSPSLTKQADAREADINFIMRKYEQTGLLPTKAGVPQYGDFTAVKDYREAMEQILEAHTAFDGMPAKLRARFHNNPGEFIAFVDNASNRKEAIELGLIASDPEPAAAAPAAPQTSEAR